MFLSSTVAYIIALTSPGPDTAIIIKQCSAFGRRAGIFTAIGIGFGILIHCFLAASGISLIILNYPALKVLISMIGGSYIFYIGASMYISNDNKISSSQNSKNNFLIHRIKKAPTLSRLFNFLFISTKLPYNPQ